MAYGFAGHIGISKETTWGSGTTATDYIEALSESMTLTFDRFVTKNIIGTLAEPDDVAGVQRIEGELEIHGHPVSIGYLLKGALQTKSVTVVASGFLWTNTFLSTKQGDDFSNETPLQPYSLEIFRDVTSSVRYTGVVVNELEIGFAPNQDVRFRAGLLARGQEIIAATTPTFPNSPAKPFTFDTVSISIAGTGTTLIEALSVTIQNNLEGIPKLNQSTAIAAIRRTDHQMIAISGTLDFTSLDEYLNFVNQTEQRFTISCTKADSFQMVIDIPRVVYTAFPLGIPGKERLTVDFEGKGYYHSGSGTAIQIDLTTTKSDY